LPVVSVPVLSKMKALIFAASSMSATFLIKMPRRAARKAPRPSPSAWRE
jgi:hypothetical protein